ncbi:MAG TPA: SusC/RagA family TonB-linked outer membrane protein [Gemmatimonadaceae bacterium]|jgi:TonB-linked SusC/RagA family outer membrane protein
MTLGRWKVVAALSAAFALVAGTRDLRAQGGTITGKVTAAAAGNPLAETRILVLATTVSATTAEDGSFTLRNVPAGPVQLQALRVGYQSQKQTVTLTAGGTAVANFALTVAVATLDEVVTTATGQQRRAEIGNAVSTLPNVGLLVDQGQNSTVSTLMEGKSSGVQILPPNMTGAAPVIRIRGLSSISLSNAPIWIVDGIRYDSGVNSLNAQSSFSMVNSLSTEEIEDIEIVKGPSAATLYGTAAANGVVLVTTKKGRAGAAKWGVTAERGVVQDATDYITMYANFGHAPGTTKPIRCKIATMVTVANAGGNCISDSLTSYNLLEDKDLTFVHNGQRSLYGANVSGGSDQVRYYLSSDVDDETGPIQMPGFEVNRFNTSGVSVRPEWFHPEAATKLNFRGNLNAAISPKLDINFNSGFARNENRLPPSGSSFEALYYTGMQNYGYKGCPGGVAPCGLDKQTTAVDGVPLNEYFQYAPGDVMQRYRPQVVQRTTLSMNTNWRPFSWMVNDGTIGLDLADRDNTDICRLNECAPTAQTRLGQVSDLKVNRRTISAKASSTGTWVARPWLNFKSTVGGDYTHIETDSVSASGTILPPGGELVGQASVRSGNEGYPVADKTLGIYGQEVAGIRDRLFLTLAVRSDQNSAFGTKFQSILYPKASVSWLASDESFFPHYNWLNSFRLRGAYGASGVQPGRTDGLITFAAGNQSLANRATGAATDTPGLAAQQAGNPDLRPEKSSELEGGFESQLLSNKVRIDYTAYLKKTHDALIQVNLAPSSGAAQLSPLQNIGSTQNTGHELQVTAQLIDRRSFAWDVTLTGSHESNKVLNLGIDATTGLPRVLNPGGTQRNLAGYPINSLWLRPYHYADANGDGVLQYNEVTVDTNFVYAGYAFPRDIFSIQNGVDLLNHTLHISALFDYRGGFTLQDGGNNFQCGTGPFACRETEDPTAPLQWQARNIAKVNGTVIGATRYTTGAGYYENGQFWKFRELSAAYSLPTIVRKYLRAANGTTLVVAARNLHTWTSYTGLDPEEFDSSNTDTQSNFQSAAPSRYITFRLNLKF